jgi:hypothetical protein
MEPAWAPISDLQGSTTIEKLSTPAMQENIVQDRLFDDADFFLIVVALRGKILCVN